VAVEDVAVEDVAVEDVAVEDVAVEDVAVEDVAVDVQTAEALTAEELTAEELTAEELTAEELTAEAEVVEEGGSEPKGSPDPDREPEPDVVTGGADLPGDEPMAPPPQHLGPQSTEASSAAYGSESLSSADRATGGRGVPAGHVEGKAAWRRLFRMAKPRTTKANVLIALLAVALGVGIATQVQLTNERGLSQLSQSELIRLLDDISSRSSRLDQQLRDLETTRDQLLSGTGNTGDALEQAQRRADTLGILAGTIGAQGPGITVSISDPGHKVTGPVILDLIQELRDAGAESIDVGGVRVVASSYVGDSGGDLSVDGTEISRPILVKAIGDSNTLASAMTIPGGIVETIRQKTANASVKESPSVSITSTHTPTEPVHARPVQ
jgi:uncharacterized protein YlxW (UPF0749 family)